jgi:hypothetical protein
MYGDLCFGRICSARLQAGMRSNLQCPPEGGRYTASQSGIGLPMPCATAIS